MPEVSCTGVLMVAVVAFLAPLLLGLSPVLRLPSVVLEIVAGIVIGPSVLGWVKVDLPLSLLSLFGLAFLLFLAGLEVELERLRGRLLAFVGSGFLLSIGLAVLVSYSLFLTRQVVSPLLIAIILVATALGVVVPVLQDAGDSSSTFGQLVIAGAIFAEFGSIILLSLFPLPRGQQHGRQTGPVSRVRAADCRLHLPCAPSGTVEAHRRSALAIAGHHSTDSRARCLASAACFRDSVNDQFLLAC